MSVLSLVGREAQVKCQDGTKTAEGVLKSYSGGFDFLKGLGGKSYAEFDSVILPSWL